MLDAGTSAIAYYVVYSSAGVPLRLLIYNSNYYDGTGTRTSTTLSFSGGGLPTTGTTTALRLAGGSAVARVDEAGVVTIGGGGTFGSTCLNVGTQTKESVAVSGGALSVTVSSPLHSETHR